MRISKDSYIIVGIFVALVLGSLTGIFFPGAAVKFEFLGSLFFNALYMIIVPLIMASMIVGITALGDVRKLGKTAQHTILYFMTTSVIAVIIGIILAVTIRPGDSGDPSSQIATSAIQEVTIGSIESRRWVIDSTVTLNIIAPNPEVTRSISGWDIPDGAELIDNGDGSATFTWRPRADQIGLYKIVFFADDAYRGQIREEVSVSVFEGGALGLGGMIGRIGFAMVQTLESMIPRNIVAAAAETRVLALIVFSLFFGGILSSMGASAKPVVVFFEVLNAAIMKLVHLVMFLAPFGVFGIVASKVGDKAGGFDQAALGLGIFSGVVILGLLIHATLLMGALRFLGERSPLSYLKNMSESLGTALGVSSSSATLPVTMECVVEKNRVDQRAAAFVLPLGTTINMDGTAMYQAIATIFVCQMYNITLGLEHYVIMLVTAVLASVGTPGLPQAGVVMMAIVMGSVGVPPEVIAQGVGIILVVDWALDRGRTALNVFGDSVGAAIIANTYEFKTAVVRRKPDTTTPSRRDKKYGSERSSRKKEERGRRDSKNDSRNERPSPRRETTGRSKNRGAQSGPFDRAAEKEALDKMVTWAEINLDQIGGGFDSQKSDSATSSRSEINSEPKREELYANVVIQEADEPLDNVELEDTAETMISQPESAEPAESAEPVEPVEPVESAEKSFSLDSDADSEFDIEDEDDQPEGDTDSSEGADSTEDSLTEKVSETDSDKDTDSNKPSFGRGRGRS